VSGFQRHRRSGRSIATFTGFEADLLRSLASQLVELLRNEAAVPDDARDPFEALMDFSGPTSEPEDPVLARLFPSAYRDDDEAASEFRRFTEGSLRDGKAQAACLVIDTLEEAGLPPQLEEDGLMIDVELEPDVARTWMRSSPTYDSPSRRGSGSRTATRSTGSPCPTTTRVRRPTTSTTGWATSRRPWSSPSRADTPHGSGGVLVSRP